MMHLEEKHFGGFTSEHFEAFAPAKRSSHRFNLERMKVAGQLGALRRRLEQELAAEIEGLSWELTPHVPGVLNGNRVDGMWLYLSRSESEMGEVRRIVDRESSLADSVQDPVSLHRFAFTGIGIDNEKVRIGLWLHARAVLDRRNLAAALADPIQAGQFTLLQQQLPEALRITVGAEEVAPEDLAARLDGLDDYLCFAFGLAPDDPRLGEDLPETIAEYLPACVKLFRYIAWLPTNDRLNLAGKLKTERRERARKRVGLQAGDQVHIIRGLLSGKKGKVEDIDARGRIKVRIGLMSIDIEPDMCKKI